MEKLKNLLNQLTTGKNKKYFIAGLVVFIILIAFVALNNKNKYGAVNNVKDKTIQAEYAGVKSDAGLKNGSFQTGILTYKDEQYGTLEVTITGQFYFRENHEKAYYTTHPYNKKEIIEKIRPIVEVAVAIKLDEGIYKYNNLRDALKSETLVEYTKDQVAAYDFTMERVNINTITLTKDSMNIIRKIEESKRPEVPSVNPNLDGGSTESGESTSNTNDEQKEPNNEEQNQEITENNVENSE